MDMSNPILRNMARASGILARRKQVVNGITYEAFAAPGTLATAARGWSSWATDANGNVSLLSANGALPAQIDLMTGIKEAILERQIDLGTTAHDAENPTDTSRLLSVAYPYSLAELRAYANAIATSYVDATGGYFAPSGATAPALFDGDEADGLAAADLYELVCRMLQLRAIWDLDSFLDYDVAGYTHNKSYKGVAGPLADLAAAKAAAIAAYAVYTENPPEYGTLPYRGTWLKSFADPAYSANVFSYFGCAAIACPGVTRTGTYKVYCKMAAISALSLNPEYGQQGAAVDADSGHYALASTHATAPYVNLGTEQDPDWCHVLDGVVTPVAAAPSDWPTTPSAPDDADKGWGLAVGCMSILYNCSYYAHKVA